LSSNTDKNDHRPPQNGDLLRQQKNQTAYLRMTARPGFFRFLHLAIFSAIPLG
jgi:hypothetical protein